MKLLTGLFTTLFCIGLGLLPEVAMWLTYGMIHPMTEIGKILTLGMFWFFGGGVCIAFGVFAFALWINFMKEIIK